jgi:hypothetical protein
MEIFFRLFHLTSCQFLDLTALTLGPPKEVQQITKFPFETKFHRTMERISNALGTNSEVFGLNLDHNTGFSN